MYANGRATFWPNYKLCRSSVAQASIMKLSGTDNDLRVLGKDKLGLFFFNPKAGVNTTFSAKYLVYIAQ